MAQEYVGGGTSKKKTTTTSPTTGKPVVQPKKYVAPPKPLPSPNVNPSKNPNSPSYKAPPKVTKPAPAPAPKVPMGKYEDIYKDTHKNVPKVTPTSPVAKKPAAPTVKKPTTTPAPKAPAKAPVKAPTTTKAPTKPTTTAPKPTTKAPTKTVQAPQKPVVSKPDPELEASRRRLQALWDQATGYKSQIDALMNGGFSYDPEKDAAYLSLQELAKKQAAGASVGAMEDMNDRGILNSTVTSDRLGQIQQSAQDAVTAQIPVLQNQAYQKHMDKISGLFDLWNTVNGQAENERAFGEDQRRWDLGYDFDREKFDTQNTQWQKEFDWQKEQQEVENGFRRNDQELDKLNYGLDALVNDQKDQLYFNDRATEQAIASAIKEGTPEKAKAYLERNGSTIVMNGGSMAQIVNTLKQHWGTFDTSPSGGGNDNPFG